MQYFSRFEIRHKGGQDLSGISKLLDVFPILLDILFCLGYAYSAFGRDRRGRILRTPPGPRGSNGKEATLGAAGKPARRLFYS